MANERLSRLQKWILAETYRSENGFLHRHEILEGFYKLRSYGKRYGTHREYYGDSAPKKAKTARVAITNCLKNMKEKGLIKMMYKDYHYGSDEPAYSGRKRSPIPIHSGH